jgi:Na+-transporting NADH:ubiquinone oxidoreductase subunit E
MLEHYLNLAVRAIFVENIALSYFLGMCSFLAISRRVETALGMGVAVIFVLGVTCPLNHVLHRTILEPGALAWLPGGETVDLSFLTFLLLIGTIAATVQVVEIVAERFAPRLYAAFGVFLPLIAVNCAILGGSLFMIERNYTLAESTIFGVGSGIGFALAIVGLAAIRERLRYSDVPPALRGLGIAFIVTGLMSFGFMAFSGIQL